MVNGRILKDHEFITLKDCLSSFSFHLKRLLGKPSPWCYSNIIYIIYYCL